MADLRKRLGEVVGSYRGTSVKMVSKQSFETQRLTDNEYIYAVVDGGTQIPLVKAGKIIGTMNPQGDVDECRFKNYKFPAEEKEVVYESPKATIPTVGGDIDIDKFIRDSLAIDLLAGWAEAMGVVETSSQGKKKQPTYDFI